MGMPSSLFFKKNWRARGSRNVTSIIAAQGEKDPSTTTSHTGCFMTQIDRLNGNSGLVVIVLFSAPGAKITLCNFGMWIDVCEGVKFTPSRDSSRRVNVSAIPQMLVRI